MATPKVITIIASKAKLYISTKIIVIVELKNV